MSTADPHTLRRRGVTLLALGAATAAVVVAGLVIQANVPGNMGRGFMVGGLVALVAAAVAAWRATARPDSATVFERAFAQTGDEHDDAVLTRALAVLGVCAVPLTGVAAIAIAWGALEEMVLALLLFAQLAVGTVAFAVVARRS